MHGAWYRHAAAAAAHASAHGLPPPPALRIVLHSDAHHLIADNEWRNNSVPLVRKLGRSPDVTVLTPDEVRDPLAAMHHLATMDVLIPSESSCTAHTQCTPSLTIAFAHCSHCI
jgi:hypothetical protein